ncbi:MAG TPA: cytochrome c3 family protein [Gemmatimonadales bacterium]
MTRRRRLLWIVPVAALGGGGAGRNLAAQDTPTNNCVSCHEIMPVERLSDPVKAFADDIHAERGFSCVACHGGDPTAPGLSGMDPARGFMGKPTGQTVLQVCGRCHSDAAFMRQYNPGLRVDQVAEYVTSVHGQRLTAFGDTNVATCVSCHPAHDIRPPSDPLSSVHPANVATTCGACHASAEHMASYDIKIDQVALYQRSIHYEVLSDRGDLSAPTCNDCHGNHGAAPPNVDWVGNVCGQCHSVMADYFKNSRHSQILSMLGAPGCATCHGNHEIQAADDRMLGLGEGAVCRRCHTSEVGGGAVAASMRRLIDSLVSDFAVADSLLTSAERAGMEVSEALFDLRGAQNNMLQARTAIHSFSVDSVRLHVGEGLEVTSTARVRGVSALDELRFRRVGLGVSSAIIVLFILGLVLKIRQIERDTPII